MPLSNAQLPTLKTHILANTNQVLFGGVNVAINELPFGNADAHVAIAAWYNLTRNPNYFAWKTNIPRNDVYHLTSDLPSSWDWAVYKAQAVSEQNAWTQMFMGDSGPIGLANFRSGVLAIFSGAGGPAAQRAHIFAIGRRLVRNIEHLFVAAVVSPPANTGNDGIPANRGTATNPDNLGYDGVCSPTDVEKALALS